MYYGINDIQVGPLFCPLNVPAHLASNLFDDLRYTCIYTV